MGDSLDGKVAGAVGKGFGTWLKRSTKINNPVVIVGRDNRYGSDKLSTKLIEGLTSTGCTVVDIGLAVTPLVHFATIKYNTDAGIIITASHNPKEFNGFRFDLRQAIPFYGEQLQEIKLLIEKEDYDLGIGRVSYKEDVFKEYIADIKGRLKIVRPLNIVIDCGNGASSKFAVEMFKELGLNVVDLYCSLDGDFPFHRPDPEMRINLESLRHKVLEVKADAGFAFDTDADRFGVADEKGNTYENDKTMIILSRDVLSRHPGSKVLCDIKSSYVLLDEIKKSGGEALMIKTGHPYFRSYMNQHNDCFLGGELSSHTFIKDDYYGYDDGMYAAARICQILSTRPLTLSQYFSDIPHTCHTEEIKLGCPDESKLEIVNQLGLYFIKKGMNVSDVDGYRVTVSPTSWFLIRASNTSPYISLRFESNNKEGLLSMVSLLKRQLENFKSLNLDILGQKLLEKAHNVG
jgi:phosphomannomutase/phosphoglucomutase